VWKSNGFEMSITVGTIFLVRVRACRAWGSPAIWSTAFASFEKALEDSKRW